MGKPKRTAITDEETEKIVRLLQETDMTMDDLAKRFQCHSTVVSQINRRFNARPVLVPKAGQGETKHRQETKKVCAAEDKWEFLMMRSPR